MKNKSEWTIMRKQIILDTNIVYYIAGLSKGPITAKEFSSYVKSEKVGRCLFISSVTLFEILARYHKHANIFRRIMCTLRNQHITVVDNPYYKKIAPFQKKLCTISQEKLDALWEEVKENKVDIEARYSTAVFTLVLSSGIVFECVDNVDDVPVYLYSTLKEVLGLSRDIVFEVIKDAFFEGYKTDDCESAVKQCFSSLLSFLLPINIALCNSTSNWEKDEHWNNVLTEEAKKEYNSNIENIKKYTKQGLPTKYISKKANKFNNKKDTISIKEYLKIITGLLPNIIPEDAIQAYIFQIVEKCITLSGVFNKNDINDAMILGAVSPNDIILTFDTDAIKHLTRFKDTKSEYTNSLNEIQVLKGYISGSGGII